MVNYLYKGKVYSFPKELGNGYLISKDEALQDTHYVIISDKRAYELKNPEIVVEEENIEQVRMLKIKEISNYDKSSAINSFIFRETETWLDKNTRVSIKNTAQLIKDSGEQSMTFWVNGKAYDIACDKLLEILTKLELYAYKCYHVTQTHLDNVRTLETIKQIVGYDYKIGYPDKLEFK